jgi:hypothetical protein
VSAPPPPRVRLSLGVTGHRQDNLAYAANQAGIATTLAEILDIIEATAAGSPAPLGPAAPTRLHCLLADGADQLAAEAALARGWELAVPLPFGQALNAAINAHPADVADARALIRGGCAKAPATRRRAEAIARLAASPRAPAASSSPNATRRSRPSISPRSRRRAMLLSRRPSRPRPPSAWRSPGG